MASPSPLQLFVLVICGAALASFSCFSVSGTKLDAGSIGLMIGTIIIGYVGVRLFARPALAGEGPASSGPTVPQALALIGSAMLLFFFSCSGALLGSFTPSRQSLSIMVGFGLAGMLVATVFTVGGVVRLVKSVARAMRRP